MLSATILPFKELETCIGAHADHNRDDFIFPRTQSITMRETKWDHREPPPFKPSIIRNLVGAIVGALAA